MVFVAEYSKAHMDHVHGCASALAISSTANMHEHSLGCVHSYSDSRIDLKLNRCKNRHCVASFRMLTLVCDTEPASAHKPAQTGHATEAKPRDLVTNLAINSLLSVIVGVMIHTCNSAGTTCSCVLCLCADGGRNKHAKTDHIDLVATQHVQDINVSFKIP